MSGYMGRLMVPHIVMVLLWSPISVAVNVLHRQPAFLKQTVALTILRIGALWIGAASGSLLGAVFAYALVNAVFKVGQLGWLLGVTGTPVGDMSREMLVRFAGIALLVGGLIVLRSYAVHMWWQMAAAALGWGVSLNCHARQSRYPFSGDESSATKGSTFMKLGRDIEQIQVEMRLFEDWTVDQGVWTIGAGFVGGEMLQGRALNAYFSNCHSGGFAEHAKALNGYFAAVRISAGRLEAVTDRIRSYPLFYGLSDDRLVLSDDARFVQSECGTNSRSTRSARQSFCARHNWSQGGTPCFLVFINFKLLKV